MVVCDDLVGEFAPVAGAEGREVLDLRFLFEHGGLCEGDVRGTEGCRVKREKRREDAEEYCRQKVCDFVVSCVLDEAFGKSS